MLRTLTRTMTRIFGEQKLIVVEDTRLTGRKYGLMAENDNHVRVSPAVFKLMQDDFDAIARDFKVKIAHRKKRTAA